MTRQKLKAFIVIIASVVAYTVAFKHDSWLMYPFAVMLGFALSHYLPD
jgi:hypothetical protein